LDYVVILLILFLQLVSKLMIQNISVILLPFLSTDLFLVYESSVWFMILIDYRAVIKQWPIINCENFMNCRKTILYSFSFPFIICCKQMERLQLKSESIRSGVLNLILVFNVNIFKWKLNIFKQPCFKLTNRILFLL
jgi:hypothetical protein